MKRRAREAGWIRSVRPARREVRVAPAPGRAHDLKETDWVEAVLADGSRLRCRVASARELANEVVMTLAAGVPRDTVARLKGAVVLSETATEEGGGAGFGLQDLKGLSVFDQTGARVGTVSQVYAAGSNEVFEVAKGGGGTLLLPAIPQVIAELDLEQGAMVLNDVAPYAVEDED